MLDRETLVYRHVSKKGYARLETTHGNLNLELHCDVVPRTCHNFIKHCRDGYYNGTSQFASINDHIVNAIILPLSSISPINKKLHGMHMCVFICVCMYHAKVVMDP